MPFGARHTLPARVMCVLLSEHTLTDGNAITRPGQAGRKTHLNTYIPETGSRSNVHANALRSRVALPLWPPHKPPAQIELQCPDISRQWNAPQSLIVHS